MWQVLNIGLAADAHIIAFERVREDLHVLPRDAPRALGLSTLLSALRISFITVMEANITTMLAMVVLYGVGTGGTVEFAFTVILSVSQRRQGVVLEKGVSGWQGLASLQTS
jgi:preprotein translocase subunit SecD